jgi:hypothetical protein
MQEFCPRINMLKGFFLKQSYDELHMVRQKVPKPYFQSQFSMSKIDRIFSKKIIQEYQFRSPFYFLKSCPIFDKLGLPVFSKYNGFL